MKTCQVKDCPAPKIHYEVLNKLSDKLEVCSFCFARLTATEKEFVYKETIKKPSEGLIRIPVINKGLSELSKFERENVTLIQSFQSDIDELQRWRSFFTSLPDQNIITFQNFHSINVYQAFITSIILESKNQYFLIFPSLKDSNPQLLSLNTVLEKICAKTLKKSDKIDSKSIKGISDIVEKHWKKFVSVSKNDFNLEIIKFNNTVLPLKQFIDYPDYPQINKNNLIKDLALIWLLWICGYKNIFESIFIEISDDNSTLELTFIGSNDFITPESKESEKIIFQEFALYLPFVLDKYQIFKEEMVNMNKVLTKTLVDEDFNKVFCNLTQGKGDAFPTFEY